MVAGKSPWLILFLLAAWSLPGIAGRASEEEKAEADEQLLKRAHVGTDAEALLTFFRQRTLTDADRQLVTEQIRRLGDPEFAEREKASRALVARGTPVLPLLRPALHDRDAEVARRAEQCITEIEEAVNRGLPAAAARQLA